MRAEDVLAICLKKGGGGGASSLSDLDDTNISSPAANQFLRYVSGKWKNVSYTPPTPTINMYEVHEWLDTSGSYAEAGDILLVDMDNDPVEEEDLMGFARREGVYLLEGTETTYFVTKILYDGDRYIFFLSNGHVFKARDDSYYPRRISTNGLIPVSGATPNITAESSLGYECGTVTAITFTPPEHGTTSVRFTVGSTAAAITLPNYCHMPAWFNAASLDTNTVYELSFVDGYGVVATW